MESSIFVLDPIKGVFWPFKVERRIYLTDTVFNIHSIDIQYVDIKYVLHHVLQLALRVPK